MCPGELVTFRYAKSSWIGLVLSLDTENYDAIVLWTSETGFKIWTHDIEDLCLVES